MSAMLASYVSGAGPNHSGREPGCVSLPSWSRSWSPSERGSRSWKPPSIHPLQPGVGHAGLAQVYQISIESKWLAM